MVFSSASFQLGFIDLLYEMTTINSPYQCQCHKNLCITLMRGISFGTLVHY